MKTLSTVLREQKITRRADILEFIKNSELVRKDNNKKIDTEDVRFRWGDSNSNFKFGGQQIYASEILVVSDGVTSIENFIEKINKLDIQIKEIENKKQEIENKINFLKESGAEKYDENEYRSYVAIKTIEKELLTDYEKAQIISKLIRG